MSFEDERELLLRWRDLVLEADPDIIIGAGAVRGLRRFGCRQALRCSVCTRIRGLNGNSGQQMHSG